MREAAGWAWAIGTEGAGGAILCRLLGLALSEFSGASPRGCGASGKSMVVVSDHVAGTSLGMSPPRLKGILGTEEPLAEPPGSGPDPPPVYPPQTTCDVGVRDEEATPCAGAGTRAPGVADAEWERRVSWGAMHVGAATLEGPAPSCTCGDPASRSNEDLDRFRDGRPAEGVGTGRTGEPCASGWHTVALVAGSVAASADAGTADTDGSSANLATYTRAYVPSSGISSM